MVRLPKVLGGPQTRKLWTTVHLSDRPDPSRVAVRDDDCVDDFKEAVVARFGLTCPPTALQVYIADPTAAAPPPAPLDVQMDMADVFRSTPGLGEKGNHLHVTVRRPDGARASSIHPRDERTRKRKEGEEVSETQEIKEKLVTLLERHLGPDDVGELGLLTARLMVNLAPTEQMGTEQMGAKKYRMPLYG
mmetsp:Transcript_41968/g.98541  ORF Transcript_41968/g.98541 Transcript_41968/m.98541 type:complete len:190 (+) Transcript_41968:529-1098(+)